MLGISWSNSRIGLFFYFITIIDRESRAVRERAKDETGGTSDGVAFRFHSSSGGSKAFNETCPVTFEATNVKDGQDWSVKISSF